MVTALRSCNVRVEKWAKECTCVARLIFEAAAKASQKWRESHGYDPKPDDLFVARTKFSERKMEVRTSDVHMLLDESRLGVKSLSSPAMAGSCRDMPQYSLAVLGGVVKNGLSLQNRKVTELVPTQNMRPANCRSGGRCVRYRSETRTRETGVKVPKCMLSVTKGVLTLRQ